MANSTEYHRRRPYDEQHGVDGLHACDVRSPEAAACQALVGQGHVVGVRQGSIMCRVGETRP